METKGRSKYAHGLSLCSCAGFGPWTIEEEAEENKKAWPPFTGCSVALGRISFGPTLVLVWPENAFP